MGNILRIKAHFSLTVILTTIVSDNPETRLNHF